MTTEDLRNTLKCRYCGSPLVPRYVNILGRYIAIGYYPCECDEAQADEEKRKTNELSEALKATDRRINQAIVRAGIPERYRNAETDREDLIALSRENGLYLWGSVGSGKTHLASAIGIESIKSGRRVRFVKAATVSASMGYSRMDEAIEVFKSPDLLIIDDLGMDNISEWSTSRMRLAIDSRYDTGKPTIITSNYSRNQLAQLVAQSDDMTARAIASRVCEMTVAIEISGKDRRIHA